MEFEHLENEMEQILTISPEEMDCIAEIRENIISKIGGTVVSDVTDITRNKLTLSLEMSTLERTDYVEIDRRTLTMIIE